MRTNWWKRLSNVLSRRSVNRTRDDQSPTPQDLGISYDSLNFEAARRQAKLGKDYARSNQTKQRLKELQQGKVTLPPHSPWDGDQTDWAADPFNDRNWRFQFHTLRWINPYLWDALSGNEASQQEWIRIVRSWAQHNTPHENAPDEYAWMDMTDGNRAIQLSIGAPLVDADDTWYIDLLVEHRNWLFDDTNIVPGNHGLHQNLGLFVVSSVLSDDAGIEKAMQRLTNQILDAFDTGGLNEEGSVGYHQMNLIWWRQAEKRLKLEGHEFPSEAAERLRKAGRTLGHLLLPDGTMPQIGDGNRGIARRGLHPFLNQVINGKIKNSNVPTYQDYENGLSVFRSGWGQTRPFKEESHTIIRHGKDLERHSHDDRGSVHIYTHGRRWITDGGFHSYQQNDPDRLYTKSRLAHSLIDLPNQEHDIRGDVPVLHTEHTEKLHSVEILDENFAAASWKRRVVFLPVHQLWVIWDRVQGDAEDLIRQQWLIDIGVEVQHKKDEELLLTSREHHLTMQWLGDQPTFDIAKGKLNSDSKRGLIGVGWKKMKAATSVHANFQVQDLDSVVVIAPQREHGLDVELSNRQRMQSFDLLLTTADETTRLSFGQDSTRVI